MNTTETMIMRYIAAQCKLRNDAYMGIDLWPRFVGLCRAANTKPTIMEPDFSQHFMSVYNELTIEDARTLTGADQ